MTASSVRSSAARTPEGNVFPIGGKLRASAAKSVKNAVERAPEFDPLDDLHDMLLPDPPLAQIQNALQTLRYEVDVFTLQHQQDRSYESQVVRVRAPGGQKDLFLVHMPRRFLNVNVYSYQAILTYIGKMFPGGSAVSVLSQGLPDIPTTYEEIMRDWGTGKAPVDARFVSWRKITELKKGRFPPKDVAERLRVTRKVGQPTAAVVPLKAIPANGGTGEPPAAGDDIRDHVDEIVDILANQASNYLLGTSEQYFQELIGRLRTAMEDEWYGQIKDFGKGDPRGVATRLVPWLINQGESPKKAGCTLIGLMMADLGTQVSVAKKDTLWGWIESCELLPKKAIDEHKGLV